MWEPSQEIAGLDEAQEIIQAHTSPRYKRLAFLESWVDGRQYDGMPSWWDDRVPLWERAPCIVYPVVDVAISSNVDLILGEGRFPTFTSQPSEDEGGFEGLDEAQSKAVDALLRDYHRATQFRAHCRDALRAAQSCGTAVAIHGVRRGKPTNENVPARWCTPDFDSDGRVKELDLQYPYVDVYQDEQGKWRARVKLYRRTITDTEDIVYLPADADKSGRKPSWRKDQQRSARHGLGFCPVVWYAFMRGCTTVAEIDGKAPHRHILDEIRQHDIARSQWHRGALYSEPQMVEIGVQPGYNPTGLAAMPHIPSTEKGGAPGPDNPVNGGFGPRAGVGMGRKKGPGYVYQYAGSKTDIDVKYLTYPSDALEAQKDNAADLLNKLQEALAVVLLDPHNIKFAATTSGKALEAIKQRQIDRCNQIRDDFAEEFLHPSLETQLRIVSKLGDGMSTARAGDVKAALEVFVGDDDWRSPRVSVQWGPYWQPSVEDEKPIVDMTRSAKDSGLLTTQKAIEKIAPLFGIDNPEAFAEELQKESEEREAKELEKQDKVAAISAKHAPQKPPQPNGKPFQ